MSEDPRLLFISSLLSLHLNIDSTKFSSIFAPCAHAITTFLDSNLQVSFLTFHSNTLKISCEYFHDPNQKFFYFSKQPFPVTDISELSIVHSTKSPPSLLLDNLHLFYSPIFQMSNLVGPKVKGLITDLETNLVNSISLSEISSLENEVLYWNNQYKKSKTDRVKVFLNILNQVKVDFDALNTSDLDYCLDLVDKLGDLLDELWTCRVDSPFPQDRMNVLLNLLVNDVASSIVEKLNKLDVMNMSASVFFFNQGQ